MIMDSKPIMGRALKIRMDDVPACGPQIRLLGSRHLVSA